MTSKKISTTTFSLTPSFILVWHVHNEQCMCICRYPSFFECRLGDGLQMSFKFIQSIAKNVASNNARGKFDAVAIAYIRQGISRIYRLIRGNRISRNKFMHSIVRKFESGYGYIPSISFLL